MKIAYIAAGAAGMYCGSCLHDNTLARALLARGEDVTLVPTYTPLRTDAADVSIDRVFMGGVNAYLLQTSRLFRWMPRWVRNRLDRPDFLNRVTRGAASVDPAKLGAMTVSMLRGEEGNQAPQLDEMVDWLLAEVRPDVVHLSNSMLLGLARRITERCGPPVVCAMSGEDIFLEALTEPHYTQARGLLRQRAAGVAAFTALNGYYADFMADYLSVARDKVHVIPHGLDLSDFPSPHGQSQHPFPPRGEGRGGGEPGHAEPSLGGTRGSGGQPQVIGYLARVCHAKGLHLLVEAAEQLAAAQPDLDFVVRAAGYLGGGDRSYFDAVVERAESGPLAGRFEYLGELDRTRKILFLRSLDVFSTPTVYRESKGLPTLEALACGTPVVLPEHGSFPEMIARTGGGLLFPPGDTSALATLLGRVLADPALARGMGEAGHRAVHEYFHAERLADETLGLYQRLLSDPGVRAGVIR